MRPATFWHRIAKPTSALDSTEQQQQAHLLISILAALLLAGTMILPIWVVANPKYSSALPISIGLYMGLLVAYAYSRTVHFQIGAWILIASIYLLIIAVLITAPNILPDRILVLNFLAIGILLASLLLSVRATIAAAVISILIIGRYFFEPDIAFAITYSFLVFTVITAALVLTSTVIRRNYIEQLRASEERYRILLAAIPDLMFRYNRNGVHVDYYARSNELLAYEPTVFMGKTIREILPSDVAEPYMQSIEQVLNTGEMAVFEYSLDVQAGHAFFEARIIQCAPNEVLAIVRNVTERHHADIALKQSEERFAKAFRNSPVPMVISTADPLNSVYIEANDAYLKLVGYTWDELKGRGLTEVGIAIQDEQRDKRLATLNLQGNYTIQEAQIYNHQHEIRNVLISAQRVIVNGVECDVELLFDVTDQRQLEKKTLQLELDAKNVQVLSQFIQDASHEFRTPLADISNRIYLLTKVQDEAKRQRHFEQAQKQIQVLSNLLDLLFIMARLDSGLPFELAATDLNNLVRSTLATYELALQEHRLTLHLDLMPNLPSVCINNEYFQHALRQVMDNAIRYTPPDGTIKVMTFVVQASVGVVIADTGVGIAPETLPLIFNRFWRHDEAHTTPGFGLGLSIAQKIMLQHSGSIAIESTVDQGTTVTLSLPQSLTPQQR